MKAIPYVWPTICISLEAHLTEKREAIFAARPKFVAKEMTFDEWMATCEAMRVAAVRVDRAFALLDDKGDWRGSFHRCAWLMAHSLR